MDGKDISGCKDTELAEIRNRQIGFVLQDFGLIGYKSVFDNVEIPLLVGNGHYKKAERKKFVMEALKKAGIANLSKRKAYELSGGQKQRVSIARTLVNKPGVILADEPTGNLDKENSQMIMEQITRINQGGTTVILVTHDEQVAAYCNRIVKMEDGILV